MDKKTTLVGAWFGTATVTIIFSILFLIYLSSEKTIQPNQQNFKLYAALPKKTSETVDGVVVADGRAKIVQDFFKGYNSTLVNYGQLFITVADKYKLDWRLLPAIAMQESNGGRKAIKETYNPFGYGIYTGLTIRFSSWEEGIERVGRALREDYLDKGLNSPAQIMAKYTPPSLASGGGWAKGISSFMQELR